MRLTREEIILICSLLAALLVGAAVKHLRAQARLQATAPAAAVAK
jgi:hypothetical protein